MGDVLAIAEQRNGALRGVAREAVSTAARLAGELGGQAHAVMMGPPGVAEAAAALAEHGAETIAVGEHDVFATYRPEVLAQALAARIEDGGYDAVLFSATAEGKDLAPRVAALLDVPLATDVTGVEVESGAVVATRPVYAGKAIARVVISATPAMLSLRPNAFPAETRETGAAVETFSPELPADSGTSKLVEFKGGDGGRKDVSEATVVVSGGRGMKDPENWKLLEELSAAIGSEAGLGASRAVVDAGWRPHAEQVGQTGKTVAPKLYFAIGISGAIQHLAGMRTAGTIVAVNKDPDAPIFQVADYGVVGDLFEVVPKLTEEIRALREGG